MKERTIRITILSVVFVLAIIAFGYWTNRGNTDMTADMGVATLPTLSFEVAEKDVNYLVGHKREMDFSAVRDAISVFGESNELKMSIHYNEGNVKEVQYELYNLAGDKKLYSDKISEVKEHVTLKLGSVLGNGEEGVLKVTLMVGEKPIYYYSRVAKEQEFYLDECLTFVSEMHENMLYKKNEDAVKKVIEPSSKGDNATLQHVTIHSDIKHTMWGELKPTVVGEMHMKIQEAKKAYVSVLLEYRVVCAGDNNEEEQYSVKEFFKVAKGKQRVYLLDYDRTMEEVFQTKNVVLSSKGVILGIASKQMPYKVNKDGTVVAFIQANELWNYNRSEDAFSLIFSFASAEKMDERHLTDKHSIQMLSIEDNGNMTFSVSGYMNRGTHEGESGISIYYYHAEKNYTEEIVYIPATESYQTMKMHLCESAYYNQKESTLYLLSGGVLRELNMIENTEKVLVENLQKGQYVASEDGRFFAYQKNHEGDVIAEIWDFCSNSKRTVEPENEEIIIPLGFVEEDFVYGVSSADEEGYDATGANVQAMTRVEIRNSKNKLVKTYRQNDIYILGATVTNQMVALAQGVKEGNVYKETTKDYITNNETSAELKVEYKSYWTDLKQTQYRLTFAKKIKDTKAKSLKPKQVIKESIRQWKAPEKQETELYYAYGYGTLAGVYEEAGKAVEHAKELSGVVISNRQNCVWEADNRVSWYRNFKLNQFTTNAGESQIGACVRKVLQYEGKTSDVTAELGTNSVEKVMEKHLETEVIRFHKCSVKDMFYLVDKGVPVIALKDSSRAVIIVGYDAKTATYLDPGTGLIHSSSIEKVDDMLKGSGNTFIGYIR